MKPPSLAPTGADVEAIVIAIANSPIVVRRASLEARLEDWENTRWSPDIDMVILGWIASHVTGRKRPRLS